MITKNLIFLTTSSLFILSLLNNLFQTCNANSSCSPSACGIIRNISSPFRLKGDPKKCGDGRFELACENNVTSISLNSHKYYVKAINYDNSTIRLVDASLNNDDICSFPTLSLYAYNFPITNFPRLPFYVMSYSSSSSIYFISCPNPLTNISSLFTDITTQCASNSSHPRYAYIKVGHMNTSELPHSCGVDLIVMTSWQEFKDLNNVSLSEIHQSLLYGFELDFCTPSLCQLSSTKSNWENFTKHLFGSNRLLLIPLALLVFIIAGVSLPLTIIIGITGVLVLSFTSFSARLDGAYDTIAATRGGVQPDQVSIAELASIWEAPAPHKAKVTAWRCLRNRLATTDNLIKRNVAITVEETGCTSCISREETASHIFLNCAKVEMVWDAILRWIGTSTARPKEVAQHYTMFSNLGRGKRSRKILKSLWLCTVWVLWKKRNECRFEGKMWEVQNLVLEVKRRLWSWSKAFKLFEEEVCFERWCAGDFLLSSCIKL